MVLPTGQHKRKAPRDMRVTTRPFLNDKGRWTMIVAHDSRFHYLWLKDADDAVGCLRRTYDIPAARARRLVDRVAGVNERG
jgi:hypothetical protein